MNARPEYFSSVASLNNRPALHFYGSGPIATPGDPDGSLDEMTLSGLTGQFTDAATLFIVARPESAGTSGTAHTLYDNGSPDTWWNFSGNSGYIGLWRDARVEGSLPVGGAALANNQIFELVVQSTAGVGSVFSDYRYFENGVDKSGPVNIVGSAGTQDTFQSGSDTHKIGNATSAVGAKAFEGYVAEILVYNRALNNAERLIVGNHLSSKYNTGSTAIGLNETLGATDRYAGDLDTNGDYDQDVFGIGRHATGDVVTTLAGGGLTLTESGGTLGNDEWLFAGHNTPTNSLVPYGDFQRWDRDFYLDKTGSLDATLTFDFSDAGLAPPLGSNSIFQLLYSTDGLNFSELGVAGVLAGDQVTFLLSNTLLQNGYYTLAITFAPEPNSMLIMLGVLGCGILRRKKQLLAENRD